MSRFKAAVAGLFVLAALLMVVPGAVMAAKSHKAPSHPWGRVFGTLVSYNSNNAVISTKAGNVTVDLFSSTAYVTYDQSAVQAGLQDGDAVLAAGRFFDGTLHADRLRYATSPFAISKLIKFNGTYTSSSSSTLTVQINKKRSVTFNTDANTRYFINGKRVSAPAYQPNEHIVVWAREYSDQSWLAKIVNEKQKSS